jgi:hypothetical protein
MKTTTQLRALLLAALAIGVVAGAALAYRNDSESVRVVGHLGPTPGPNSKGHVEAKRAYLDRLALLSPERPAAGLVSFARLVTPGGAAMLTKSMDVQAVFISIPQGGPEALPIRGTIEATVAARAKELAEIVRGEIASLETQVRDAQGASKQSLAKALAARKAALVSVGPACRCVYAMAIERSTLGALAQLGKRPEVLLVDVPNPLTDALAGWELTPILPKSPA